MPEPDLEIEFQPLLTRPLRDLVTFRINRLNAKLTMQASRILSEAAGITLTQWRLFALIDFLGPMTAAEIARQTHFDKALVSRTVRTLLAEGLLASTPSGDDQRSYVLALTVKGQRLAERARPAMRARQDRLLGSMDATDLATFFACLDRLDATIEDMEKSTR